MSVMFDTLQYTKGAEAIGIKREHAEYAAEQINKLVNNELVGRSYLSEQLKSVELNIIKWMLGVSLAQAGIIISVVGFMLKH